jgi:lipopolysaccharide assembly outer membrane protein LptD (OstA)
VKGKTPESNLSQGDTITVYFDKEKIDRALVRGSARGEYQLGVDLADSASVDEELIRYDAKQIAYVVSKDRIVLDGDAHLTYRDLELQARKVEYDVEKQTLLAEGNPELVDRGDKVTGNIMTYDLESRVGNIYSAQTTFERGLYHGNRIRKVNDNELHIMGGSYTTCDRQNPH